MTWTAGRESDAILSDHPSADVNLKPLLEDKLQYSAVMQICLSPHHQRFGETTESLVEAAAEGTLQSNMPAGQDVDDSTGRLESIPEEGAPDESWAVWFNEYMHELDDK